MIKNAKIDQNSHGEGHSNDLAHNAASVKRTYKAPLLTIYGAVSVLTQAGISGSDEGSASDNKNMARRSSDVRLKESIVRVGDHPLGFGLYLFSYKSEFEAKCGKGRHFGVLAQEVEAVVPDAVQVDFDGYKMVNHTMLGIRTA